MKYLKKKKTMVILSTIIGVVILLFLFKIPVLRGIGNLLISEDAVQKAEVIFVLGGGSLDRGNEAARLVKAGLADKVITTGGNIPSIMEILYLTYTEAELATLNIIRNGVSDDQIVELSKGTSTKEEAAIIADYCSKNNIKSAIVLTDKFHTSRVRKTFAPVFEEKKIELVLLGAPSSQYVENEWWKYEQGLIMVNNEYLKHFYYFLKY